MIDKCQNCYLIAYCRQMVITSRNQGIVGSPRTNCQRLPRRINCICRNSLKTTILLQVSCLIGLVRIFGRCRSSPENTPDRIYTADICLEDINIKNKIVELLRDADLGISDFYVSKEPLKNVIKVANTA